VMHHLLHCLCHIWFSHAVLSVWRSSLPQRNWVD
jgi:hypothetical protein